MDSDAATDNTCSLILLPAASHTPIHHTFLHPATMRRLHIACNQPLSLYPTSSLASPSSQSLCLLQAWPSPSLPQAAVAIHSFAASAFTLTSCATVRIQLLPPAVAGADAAEVEIVGWSEPVSLSSQLSSASLSQPPLVEHQADATTFLDMPSVLQRQLLGRSLVSNAFTIVTLLLQPHLLYIARVIPASSFAQLSLRISSSSRIVYTTASSSPLSLLQPAPSLTPAAARSQHIAASFPSEWAAISAFLTSASSSLYRAQLAASSLLLSGASGTGKSSLLAAISSATFPALHVVHVQTRDVIADYAASSSASTLLTTAIHSAQSQCPSVLVLHDVTPLICSSAFPQLSAQLSALLESCSFSASSPSAVSVIASCEDAAAVLPQFLRAGRFDQQISIRPLSLQQRACIIAYVSRTGTEATVQAVAERTHGFNARMLVATCKLAALLAVEDAMEKEEIAAAVTAEGSADITWEQWMQAVLHTAPPSSASVLAAPQAALSSPPSSISLSASFASSPLSCGLFPLVGGYATVKRRLTLILHSFLHPPSASAATRPAGILLHGAASCGKSLLASSLSSLSSSLSFSPFHVHLPTVLSPFLGETERSLRSLFSAARSSAPSVVVIDQLDALTSQRSSTSSSSSSHILSTLLTLLDGIEGRQGVLLVATAVSLTAVDAALQRPGRFSTVLEVHRPSQQERVEIAQVVARHDGIEWDADSMEWDEVGSRTAGAAGGDMQELVRRSAWMAWREQGDKAERVSMRHVRQAMAELGWTEEQQPEREQQRPFDFVPADDVWH